MDGDFLTDSDTKITDYCFKDGILIGTAMTKEVELEIKNSENYDLADKSFDLEIGVMVDDTNKVYEYVPYGEYTVTTYEDLKSNQKYKIIAYDNMNKLNPDFKENTSFNPTFPITMKEFYRQFMASYGIEIEEQKLPNENFIVTEMPNFDGYTGRSILMRIAEIFGSFAKINRLNKCQMYLKTETDIQVGLESMNSKLEIDNRYGPVNVVSVGMSNVEGENVTLKDEESITQYGETTIRIDDNPFIYTEDKREAVINDLYTQLHNFTYVPVKFNLKALMYSDCGDAVQIRNMEDTEWIDTIILNQNINVPRTRQSSIETKALTNTQQKLQYISQSKQAKTRTEIIVDKQNQKIESVISNVTEQNNKISQVTQTVDELNSKISDIADITTSQESINGKVSLEKINQSEPIYVKIYPRAENVSYLYPHSNLYPSETLYLKTRTLRFANTTTNKYVDYELPDNLLYYDAENYDEFILDYDAQSCVINKKVGYNADGTTYLLENPTTIEYEYPKIELEDGDYTVELLGYTDTYLFVRLMAQNIYTTQFATRAEVNSEISQKADEITATVSKSYATKGELNTAKSEIKQTTTNISSEVSKKVGNDEIISKINQTAEEITIDASKLNINGTVSANGNFKIDTKGNMTCKNANITSGVIELKGGTTSSPNFRVTSEDEVEEASVLPALISCTTWKNGDALTNFDMQANDMQASSTAYSDLYWAKMRSDSSYFSNADARFELNKYSEDNIYSIFVLNDTSSYLTMRRNSTSINDFVNETRIDRTSTVGQNYINEVVDNDGAAIHLYTNNAQTRIYATGITTPKVTQTSKAESKKNFEKFENGLEVVKNTDIYKYHLKSQEDTEKKEIGFVIGNEYKYAHDITSVDKEGNEIGVDTYSMISVAYKAIQEQQELIEQLQKEIQELKGEK